jgi:outer membrane protein OmpA-like peptidoglycan-associated protein
MTQRSKPVWAGLRHLTIVGLIGSGLGVLALPNLSDAQVPYSMGDGNPSVTVDLGVLNQLGPAENVPGLLNRGLRGGYALPGYAPQQSGGYASSPSSAVIGTAPQVPGWLQRQGGAQYAPVPPAAAPRALAPTRAPTRTATAPTLTAPTLTAPARQTPVRQAPASTSGAAPAQQTASRTPPPPPPAAEASPPRASTPRASTPAPSPQPTPTRTAAATPPPVPRTPPVATTSEPTASSSGSTARASAPPPPPAIPQAPSVEPAKTTVSAPPPPPPPAATSQVASAPATQPAAAPAAAPSAQGAGVTRVMFPSGESQLPDAGKSAMEPVIKQLQSDENLRLQLKAYASGGQDSTNTARRLSLSRALAVRAFLIDNKIQSTRMDVRALGDRSEGGPADRVDLVVVSP